MPWRHRLRARSTTISLILIVFLSLSCSSWALLPPPGPPEATPTLTPEDTPQPPTATPQPLPVIVEKTQAADPEPAWVGAGEPAGCLTAGEQDRLGGIQGMLEYADSLLELNSTFDQRKMPVSWNAYTGEFAWDEFEVISLTVEDVKNQFLVQRMLNALHVAGFVAWLRSTPNQGLHILALPLLTPALLDSPWAPYVQAYWSDLQSLPDGDDSVIATLKLPPCAWMEARGFAPRVSADWWAGVQSFPPDYASAAQAYLAETNEQAYQVANAIDWLGPRFPEGPETMCGPLVWAILNDAGAFPPGWGDWRAGPKTFWLAKPSSNGRPWSLFPKETYSLYKFEEAMGSFDFSAFPLYPGDFLYLYSERDGYDHMLLVTEADQDGGAYTVTNLVQVEPEEKTTIERVLLISLKDPEAGTARNRWARDKVNGRTGHAGFEVFRWKWMEKDIAGLSATHVVQPGDTFGSIAALWKTPAGRIAEYNGMVTDASLQVGQKVLIPPNQPVGR